MTGQVKEDLISRLGEMGAAVEDGRLEFRRHLVSGGEFLSGARTFAFRDIEGRESALELEPGTMAFTVCQTPVVSHRAGPERIGIARGDGSRETAEGLKLDARTSAEVFERSGAVARLDVWFGLEE
jgi:hypothetical protein